MNLCSQIDDGHVLGAGQAIRDNRKLTLMLTGYVNYADEIKFYEIYAWFNAIVITIYIIYIYVYNCIIAYAVHNLIF